jgi:hypothetical protein
MRCSCPKCGTYMVQKEMGANSACVCPKCLHACDACMGSGVKMQKGGSVPWTSSWPTTAASMTARRRNDELHHVKWRCACSGRLKGTNGKGFREYKKEARLRRLF